MVEIYTKKSAIPPRYKDYKILEKNDGYFGARTMLDGLDSSELALIERYEQVKISNGFKCETRDNLIIDIAQISTGTKTLINLIHLGKYKRSIILDISECGENIMREVFILADKYGIPLFLTHNMVPDVPEVKISVNGQVVNSYLHLDSLLIGGDDGD